MTNGFNVLFYCSIMISFAGKERKEIIVLLVIVMYLVHWCLVY